MSWFSFPFTLAFKDHVQGLENVLRIFPYFAMLQLYYTLMICVSGSTVIFQQSNVNEKLL